MKQVHLLGSIAPLEYGRAKNIQNLPRFRTTFEFGRKYLEHAVNTVLPKLNKKLMNFGPLTKTL